MGFDWCGVISFSPKTFPVKSLTSLGLNLSGHTSAVLEMAGRQVTKCDQKSFGVTSFGICRTKNYVWATNSESMHVL